MFKQDPEIPQDPKERRQKYATIFDKTFNEDTVDDNKKPPVTKRGRITTIQSRFVYFNVHCPITLCPSR